MLLWLGIGNWKFQKPRNDQQLRKSMNYTTIDCAKGHLTGWVLPIPNHKAPYNSKSPKMWKLACNVPSSIAKDLFALEVVHST
jgi:hypothetical protein